MRSILLLGVAAALFTAPRAHALDDEQVVVTATRQPNEAERLPADVDVIDIDEARNRGIDTLAEALETAPGVNVVQSGGFGQQTGLFTGGGNSNHTLVLFDGMRLNDPASPGSSFDAGQDTLGGLTRIEVVQGPMSAVYGSDAIGGVVNLIPRHGRDGPLNAQLDVWGGSFDTMAATAGLDGALGALRYAITGEAYATAGYDLVPARMSTHTGDRDGAESAAITGVFDLDLTEDLALDLLIRRRTARADFDAFIFPPPTFNERRVDDPDLEIAQNDLTVARIGAAWRITERLSLRATGGRLDHDREERDGGVTTARFEGERRFADLVTDWRFAETGVLQNAGIVAGVEIQTEQIDVDQGFAIVRAEQAHRGAFITAQADVGRLTLTGAVRLDDFEGFGAETTWRLGASFGAFDEALRMYAAYGASFRAPTLYERFIAWGDPNLAPEHGVAWEVGADTHFAAFGQENGVGIGALYRSAEIEDLIDFNSFFVYANVDEARIDSAEAYLALHPASWLSARVAYIYTDARDSVADTPLLRRPENVWLASLDFERGAFSAQLAWRSVGSRADQIYGDDGYWQGVGVTPGYDVLRASAGWDVTPAAHLFIAADNLADESYEPANAFAGAPRTVMVGVRLRPPSGD